MIDFSRLSMKEKDKYTQFLLDNKVHFSKSDSGYMAQVKVQNKENQDPIRRVSPIPRKSVSPMSGQSRKKLSKEGMLQFIQEVYSRKFQDASVQIQTKSLVNEDFRTYVQRYANEKNVDLQGSLQCQNENVDLFKRFLQKEYEEEDLMYFLFVRAIVDKELSRDQNEQSVLTSRQVENVVTTVFGNDQREQIAELLGICQKRMVCKKISAFDFTVTALHKYYEDRKPLNLSVVLQELLYGQLRKFFDECESGVNDGQFEDIKTLVNDLLSSIVKMDKRIWFNRVSNPRPEELLYMENLQKVYKQMSIKSNPSKDELNQLSRRIMQTPQLGKCIAQLLE